MLHHRYLRSTLFIPLAVVVVSCAVVRDAAADEEESATCEGVFEGYVLDDGGCYSQGFWKLDLNLATDFFNFHFHGWTGDADCFGIRGESAGTPAWVDGLLEDECGLCIDEAETRIQVNRQGRVLVVCHGFASPCPPDDTEPPTIVSVEATSSTKVVVTFSEPMNKDPAGSRPSVEDISNYTIVPGAIVVSATRNEADPSQVFLVVSPMNSGQLYRITISNVQDLAGNGLASPNFTFFYGF